MEPYSTSVGPSSVPDPLERRPAPTTLRRDKQRYTWLRSPQGRNADFWRVACDALDYELDSLDLAPSHRRDKPIGLHRHPSASRLDVAQGLARKQSLAAAPLAC